MCLNQQFTNSDPYLIRNTETGEDVQSTCYAHALANVGILNYHETKSGRKAVYVLVDKASGETINAEEPMYYRDKGQFERGGFLFELDRKDDSLWNGYKISDPVWRTKTYLGTTQFRPDRDGEYIYRYFAEQYKIDNNQ